MAAMKPVNLCYVGLYVDDYVFEEYRVQREVFRSTTTPTSQTHSKYNAVIGPFRSHRGALFMAMYGRNNPHCRTVQEAETLGLKYAAELRESMRQAS